MNNKILFLHFTVATKVGRTYHSHFIQPPAQSKYYAGGNVLHS